MHGLIIRSFENFIRQTYGPPAWAAMMAELDAGFDDFEPMFHYDGALVRALLAIGARRLDKPQAELLEDFGTFLVAHPASERVRRLLRFGGVDFEDFLASLEDLAGRAHLAVPDLGLPDLALTDLGGGEFRVEVKGVEPEFTPVFTGLLRTLADDYGALVLVGDPEPAGGHQRFSLRLLEADFAEGRGFALAERAAG